MELYYNDHEDKDSIKVNSKLIPELIGIETWEYYQKFKGDYREINKIFKEFSFTEEAMYD